MANVRAQVLEFTRLGNMFGFFGQSKIFDRIKTKWEKETIKLIRRGFETSTDPDGVKWRPLVYPNLPRKGGPLRKTDKLMNSWRVKVTPTGINARSSRPYASFHQEGVQKTNLPARKMIPDAATPGPVWVKAYREIAMEELRKAMVKQK